MFATQRARLARTFAIPASIVGLVVGGFSVGLALAEDAPSTQEPSSSEEVGTTGQVEGVNENGQAYGTSGGPAATAELLDLVEVVATNGLIGFVDRVLLDSLTGGDVSSPEEAVAFMEEIESATWETQTIPVYLLDGLTQIGVFEVSRGDGGEDIVGDVEDPIE